MQPKLLRKGQVLRFDPKSSFTILSKGHVVNLPFSEITLITKQGHETLIHTPDGHWRTYHSLQEILHELPVNDFFRVHKSQVVALRFVEGFDGCRVRVGGQSIPMTNYYRMMLISQLADILNKGYKWMIHEPTGRTVILPDATGYRALPPKTTGPAM